MRTSTCKGERQGKIAMREKCWDGRPTSTLLAGRSWNENGFHSLPKKYKTADRIKHIVCAVHHTTSGSKTQVRDSNRPEGIGGRGTSVFTGRLCTYRARGFQELFWDCHASLADPFSTTVPHSTVVPPLSPGSRQPRRRPCSARQSAGSPQSLGWRPAVLLSGSCPDLVNAFRATGPPPAFPPLSGTRNKGGTVGPVGRNTYVLTYT